MPAPANPDDQQHAPAAPSPPTSVTDATESNHAERVAQRGPSTSESSTTVGKRKAQPVTDVNPFDVNPPREGITLHNGKGGEAFVECEWRMDVEHETRDAREGDPEWHPYIMQTIATGKSTGTIRFTAIAKRYRP